ncbi:MAG: 3-hydroxyacyl-CoA dehydrogenase NAD-binding domain-containing protein [Gammaproteobacteria bacterium]
MSAEPAVTTPTAVELDGVENWRLQREPGGLCWLTFDCADAATNTLSAAVLGELGRVVDVLTGSPPRGLIVRSAKDNGFAAGADIREFDQMLDVDATVQRIGEVHALFARIETLSFPTVACVHGFCLGGGLELALACRHIVAVDESTTRLGFPEVLLGIHPGFGGTVRAVRYCGAVAGLELMLTGRAVGARRALQLGLVDRAVPVRHLDSAARHFASAWQPRRETGMLRRAAGLAPARPLVARVMRREVTRRAPEAHYPAPHAVLELWRKYGGNERAQFDAEARSIARLLTTSTSRNLVRLFKLQERLKSHGRTAPGAVQRVHVIGAGTMGGDIAAWCALRGMEVTLQDRAPRYAAAAFKRAAALFRSRLRDRYERQAAHDRLSLDIDGHGLRRADVVIEAIIEDVAAKRELFADIETRAPSEALLATNTSSIRLEDIAEVLREPARLTGVHFFNPVARMQLVEVIAGDTTDAAAAARACAFVTAIDRLPLPARSAPGFLINRVLSPYLQEAMLLLEEGAAVPAIDHTAKQFGMPMGPLELADTVGLDICLHVGEILAEYSATEVPAVLRKHVAAGRLGRKSGAGFYSYAKGRPRKLRDDGIELAQADIRDRLVLRLVNEAVACLREGIVSDAELIDAGIVFGTGFAPFRGGPLQYVCDRGIDDTVARLERLAASHGSRFEPDVGWDDFANALTAGRP